MERIYSQLDKMETTLTDIKVLLEGHSGRLGRAEIDVETLKAEMKDVSFSVRASKFLIAALFSFVSIVATVRKFFVS